MSMSPTRPPALRGPARSRRGFPRPGSPSPAPGARTIRRSRPGPPTRLRIGRQWSSTMIAVSCVTLTGMPGSYGVASSHPTSDEGSKAALFEEAVLGARQSEVLAQGLALVFAAKQPAALQFRHDLIDKIGEAAGYVREHDVEPVAG